MRPSSNDKTPRVKPVRKIELSEEHLPLRIALVFVLMAIAAVALVVFLTSLLNTDPGWKVVEVDSSERNCSSDFVFNYDFGDAGISATAEYKQVLSVYTEATRKAYWLFNKDEGDDRYPGIYHVNTHVNESVEVDPALYHALTLLEEAGNRNLYLAPMYAQYDNLFSCEDDVQASLYAPEKNRELAAYFDRVIAFIQDPAMINLELLGDCRVRLHVSAEYLAFAAEEEIDAFLDFHWMTNAFIVDYLAEQLQQNGYTNGYLTSFDGFTRNLDLRGNSYSFNIFNRESDTVYMAARMSYNKPCSIVFLRAYGMTEPDRWHYYNWSDGHINTAYVDAADGRSKTAAENLVSYSGALGCAETLLRVLPVYLSDSLDTAALNRLTVDGVYSLWCEGRTIRYNDEGIWISDLYEKEDVRYNKSFAGN